MKDCIYYCMIVWDYGKIGQGVCGLCCAGFSLLFAETILLAIVLPFVNAIEYFVGYCLGFRGCWNSCRFYVLSQVFFDSLY